MAQLQSKLLGIAKFIKRNVHSNSDIIGNFLALLCLMGSVQVLYNLQWRIFKVVRVVMNQIVCRKFAFWLIRTLFGAIVQIRNRIFQMLALASTHRI